MLALLPNHAQARSALERMLAAVPEERRDIVEILEPLFEQDGDYARLSIVLEARLAIIDDPIDRSTILQRLVELAEDKLNDRARALDAVLRWLSADPASQQALSETERLADRLGQWKETAARIDSIACAPPTPRIARPTSRSACSVFLRQGPAQRPSGPERRGDRDLSRRARASSPTRCRPSIR